jgi:hypothetical protein
MVIPEFPKFTAKEHKYLDYIRDENNSRNCRYMEKALHTTGPTLIGQTIPSVHEKLEKFAAEWDKYHVSYNRQDVLEEIYQRFRAASWIYPELEIKILDVLCDYESDKEKEGE